MRAIILAAGRDVILDGMIKCLIRHPGDGRTILEHAASAFSGMEITVVVGYRAVEIIQTFPHFHYVFNSDWAITNSAYSLGLALDNSPCFVASGDLLFDPRVIRGMVNAPADVALTCPRENRGLTAIHAIQHAGNLVETYMGPLRDPAHEELLGLYKISHPRLLARWKKDSLEHSNLYNGQTLPVGDESAPVAQTELPAGAFFHEVNTVQDYLRLVEACR